MNKQITGVWIFNGANAKLPGGIFSEREKAESWIMKHRLTGILTLYPLDQGIYDWAINNNFFAVKKENQSQPEFIQGFTSASQEHSPYEDGELA